MNLTPTHHNFRNTQASLNGAPKSGARETGASSSAHATNQASVKFEGIGPNAISQFVADTLGVWAPKMPFVRSKTQFFEDTFLEFVEDAAFYFTVPLAGQYLLAPIFNKLVGLTEKDGVQAIGTSVRNLGATASKELIAAKSGTLLGALALAGGFEYMIQHAKNVITARHFKTKNFTAVAGLEKPTESTTHNEEDPVQKAKRRLFQVGTVVAALSGASLILPFAIKSSPTLVKVAKNILHHIDFSSKSTFDLTKPILAVLIATGVVSYIDAARDSLERKETATRLLFVVPYLLFGKDIAANLLGKFFENQSVGKGADKFIIKDKVRFLDKAIKQESFLNFNIVKPSIFEEVQGLEIANTLKEAILSKHHQIKTSSYLLSALAIGCGLCLLTNYQTKQRFNKKQEAQLKEAKKTEQLQKQKQLLAFQ
ncbi:MAG: hypothetical protein K2X66_12260, partial [Cyanobacteria bacterium]|nr:hypothetical protein [Cyanobacteriota bacterium]